MVVPAGQYAAGMFTRCNVPCGPPLSSHTHTAAPDEDFLEEVDVSGLGLGLYLARDVMERMGGTISVETSIGEGSTFTLHLPIWEAGMGGNAVSEGYGNAETSIGG